MTRDQWERLKVLFNGALAQVPEDRNQWLADHAAGEEMLVRETVALIVAHETADHFLEVPVALEPADLTDAIRLEQHGDPLGALERDIASSLRAHDEARESTARGLGRIDQLIESMVRNLRRLVE